MHAAAWVQAVGSVLAILIAVAIPAWQRHTARTDRQQEQFLQARSLLFGVSAELVELIADHESAKNQFAQAKGMGRGSGEAVRGFIGRANIAVPPMLLAGMDRFYLLGEPAALTLPQLVTVTLQYERKLLQIINGIAPTVTGLGFADSLAPLREHVNLIGTLLQQLETELKRFDIVEAHSNHLSTALELSPKAAE